MLSLKNIIIACCTFLFVQTVKAQNVVDSADYVINTTGDTLKCHINIPLIGAINYTVDGGKTTTKIKPAEIKEYYVARKNVTLRSVTKKGKSKPLFLQLIEKGQICLYEEIKTTYSANGVTYTNTIWHVSKGSDIVQELKFSNLISFNKQARKEAFAEMISDKKEVYDKFMAENEKFSFEQIKKLVQMYNSL